MKKGRKKSKINIFAMFVISLILFITFFIIYFLQANIFPSIPIAGIVPNLFVIYILFIGLFGNSFLAILFGIFCGLWIDIMYANSIGISSASFTIIGFIASWFDSLWSKDEKISIIIMVIEAVKASTLAANLDISLFLDQLSLYIDQTIDFVNDMK